MTGKQRPKARGPKWQHFGKFGHIRRSSNERVRTKFSTSQKETNNKLKVNRAEVRRRDSSSSDNDCIGVMVNHMMLASSSSRMKIWIVDSGATCHMCSDVKLRSLKKPLQVTLENRCAVEAIGQGTVVLENYMRFSMCLYNLLSTSTAVKA